jgi:hypothetical protein
MNGHHPIVSLILFGLCIALSFLVSIFSLKPLDSCVGQGFHCYRSLITSSVVKTLGHHAPGFSGNP